MTVADLINQLLAFDNKDAEVIVRDINGLDWILDEHLVFLEGPLGRSDLDWVVISSEGINQV
jgi:hypothetical protein